MTDERRSRLSEDAASFIEMIEWHVESSRRLDDHIAYLRWRPVPSFPEPATDPWEEQG